MFVLLADKEHTKVESKSIDQIGTEAITHFLSYVLHFTLYNFE